MSSSYSFDFFKKKISPKTFGPHCVFRFSNFSFENRAVCEIMWKNIVERGRPQIAIHYGACVLPSEYELSIVLHCNSGYGNALHRYVYAYIACVFSIVLKYTSVGAD